VGEVALKAEAGAVEKLLRTQPSHDWHCEFELDSNQQIRCQIGALQIDPVDIPGPSTLQFEIQAGALQTASQGRNRRLRGSFSTGLPSLLLESQDTDARGLPRVTLYSDFPISEDSVATHLYFQQGARRWAAKIAAAPISTFTERESFVINYPQSSGTELDLAASADLQLVQTAGLTSNAGNNIGVEKVLTGYAPIPDFRVELYCVENCFAEDGLQIKFSRMPNADTAANIRMQLATQGLQPNTDVPIQLSGNRKFAYPDINALPRMAISPYIWVFSGLKSNHPYQLQPMPPWAGTIAGQGPHPQALLHLSTTKPRREFGVFGLALQRAGSKSMVRLNVKFAEQAAVFVLGAVLGGVATKRFEYTLDHSGQAVILPLQKNGGTAWGAVIGRMGRSNEPTPMYNDVDRASGTQVRSQLPLTQAIAAQGLHSIAIQGNVYAVVTDLETAQSAAGVEVELLDVSVDLQSARAQLLATAKTNAEGIAQFRNPAGSAGALRYSNLVLRAHAGKNVTVLPFAVAGVGLERSRQSRADRWGLHGQIYGQKSQQYCVSHFVTEKMRYRLGETVRFQVFVRQSNGGNLAQAASVERIKVTANAWQRAPLAELDLALDNFGSAVGEFVLTGPKLPPVIDITTDCGGTARIRVQELDAPIQMQLSLSDRDLAFGQSNRLRIQATGTGLPQFVNAKAEVMIEQRFGNPLNEHFPGFTFDGDAFKPIQPYTDLPADCYRDDVNTGARVYFGQLDRDGAATTAFEIPKFPCDFGELHLHAELDSGASEPVFSSTQTLTLGKFTRYLGIQAPRLLSAEFLKSGQAIQVRAAAVNFSDMRLTNAKLKLHLQQNVAGNWRDLAECALTGDTQDSCTLAVAKQLRSAQVSDAISSGPTFRWLAQADGYPDLIRWVYLRDFGVLQQARAEIYGSQTVKQGELLSYRIKQPFEHARALLSLESDGILHQQWFALNARESEITLPTQAEWHSCFAASVLIVPIQTAGAPLLPSAAAQTHTCITPQTATLVRGALAFAKNKHGTTAALTLHSLSNVPLILRVNALDAALVSLDPDLEALRAIEGPGWLGEKYLGATGESFSLLTLALPEHRWLPGAIALDSVIDKLGQFLRAQATLDAQRFPNTDRKLETRIAPEYRFPTFDEQLDDQELGRSWRSGAPWQNIRTLSDRIRARDVFVAHQAGRGARSANGESVLWRSVLLKPGATQTLSVHLPENRSGWRFEVFAADAEGGFQRLLLDAPSGKSE